MRFLYNIFFLIFFILSSPYYFLKMLRRGKWRTGFRQRFGYYDHNIKQALTNRHVLWLHAVSVGEMNICVQLCRAITERMPNLKLIVSTTTTTAMAQLQDRLPAQVSKIYYPIDRKKYVAQAFASLHPNAIVLIESEIWPNFIWYARARNKPLFLANARLSDRSYPRYKRFGFIFRNLFASFSGVGAQNEEDAAKLRGLGCRPEAVRIVGNLKFDAVSVETRLDVPALLAKLGIPADAPLLVAGSTHAGEEALLAQQFLRLRAHFPDLFGRELSGVGIKFIYRSEINSDTNSARRLPQCLLVNTTGELMSFYKYATVVFVGKSITARGGQNPIEPAALGKPVVFGPNMQNFPDVVRILLAGDGAVQVKDADELEQTFASLLADPARREQLGRNAENIVRENQGAVDRTVEMIVEKLQGLECYIAPQKRSTQ
jgi:3-deoxy-D-manno-octulosonic-acid transferase